MTIYDMTKHLPRLTTYLPRQVMAGCLLLATIFLLTGCSIFNKLETRNSKLETPTVTPTPAETQLPPDQRPVITMKPDAKIQNVELTITKLPSDVATVDYELVYNAGDLQRGVIGTYTVSKGKATLLLGSCSSGVCKYDKNVSGGQLTIKYRTNGQRILLREPLKLN